MTRNRNQRNQLQELLLELNGSKAGKTHSQKNQDVREFAFFIILASWHPKKGQTLAP